VDSQALVRRQPARINLEEPVTNRLDLPEITWRRISPKYVVSEFLGLIVTAIVMGSATIPLHVVGWQLAPLATGVVVGLLLLYAAFTPRRVRAIGYQLREDDLVFRRGILFQRFVAVPYGRMQLVDINRGPLARALGLSELKFVTAAASTGVTIPGLPEAEAEDLRDKLVELAESRRAGL
jgi:uncharacterized protein